VAKHLSETRIETLIMDLLTIQGWLLALQLRKKIDSSPNMQLPYVEDA